MGKLARDRIDELDALLAMPDPEDGDLCGLDGDIGLGLEFRGNWESLTEAQSLFMGSYLFEMDVNNGGLHQFFWNQGPDGVRAALQSLRYSGLDDVAAVLQRAVDVVPNGLPEDHSELQDCIEDEDDVFDAIDSEFFGLKPYPPLAFERLKIVRRAVDDFFE